MRPSPTVLSLTRSRKTIAESRAALTASTVIVADKLISSAYNFPHHFKNIALSASCPQGYQQPGPCLTSERPAPDPRRGVIATARGEETAPSICLGGAKWRRLCFYRRVSGARLFLPVARFGLGPASPRGGANLLRAAKDFGNQCRIVRELLPAALRICRNE